MSGRPPIRLAYLVTHPIQYQAPLLKRIAAEPGIALTVFFRSDWSVRGFDDPGFGRRIEWDVPLLEGYDHQFLPAWGDARRITPFWRPFSRGLARRLIAARAEILWVHGYARFFHWVALAEAKALGLKVLLRDEATAISAPRTPSRRAAKRAFFLGLRQLVDGYLAIGSLNRAYYEAQGVPPRRLFDMPYAVDNDRFAAAAALAAADREQRRAAFGLAPGRPVVLFAGKLTPIKAPEVAVAALARLKAAAPAGRSPYLLLAGDGPLRPALEGDVAARGLADEVRFLGFRNQRELPALYDLCDVFLLPSRREPWGLVVNEAMNAGRAIVASDQVGSAADLVRPGVNGAIVPAGDDAALAAALADIVGDPARCRAMGEASRRLIAGWGFEQDVAGLKQAMAAVLARPEAAR
jgi:glycosyltransferase involved in cell wall biosynthesis